MSKFHRLPIARVDRETRDAVAITFAVPDALREQFRYAQGQHLTLRASVGGADLRRSYSICSAV
jgi:ring-1,2-phenylacetyl-CoA epoxidase subunit PaaE